MIAAKSAILPPPNTLQAKSIPRVLLKVNSVSIKSKRRASRRATGIRPYENIWGKNNARTYCLSRRCHTRMDHRRTSIGAFRTLSRQTRTAVTYHAPRGATGNPGKTTQRVPQALSVALCRVARILYAIEARARRGPHLQRNGLAGADQWRPAHYHGS